MSRSGHCASHDTNARLSTPLHKHQIPPSDTSQTPPPPPHMCSTCACALCAAPKHPGAMWLSSSHQEGGRGACLRRASHQQAQAVGCASHQASEGVGGASPAAWWVVHHPVPTCTAWVVDHQFTITHKPHHHHKHCKVPRNNAAPKEALSHTTPECIEPRFD